MTEAQWALLERIVLKRKREAETRLRKLPEHKPHWEPGQGERIRRMSQHQIKELDTLLRDIRAEQWKAGRSA